MHGGCMFPTQLWGVCSSESKLNLWLNFRSTPTIERSYTEQNVWGFNDATNTQSMIFIEVQLCCREKQKLYSCNCRCFYSRFFHDTKKFQSFHAEKRERNMNIFLQVLRTAATILESISETYFHRPWEWAKAQLCLAQEEIIGNR